MFSQTKHLQNMECHKVLFLGLFYLQCMYHLWYPWSKIPNICVSFNPKCTSDVTLAVSWIEKYLVDLTLDES